MSEWNIAEHTVDGYATFESPSNNVLYVLTDSNEFSEAFSVYEIGFLCNATDTDYRVTTDDWWFAEHSRGYLLTSVQAEYIDSGEWFVNKRTGELASMYELQQLGLDDTIGTDWDGMGVEYVGNQFLDDNMSRLDFPNIAGGLVLFFAVGD